MHNVCKILLECVNMMADGVCAYWGTGAGECAKTDFQRLCQKTCNACGKSYMIIFSLNLLHRISFQLKHFQFKS